MGEQAGIRVVGNCEARRYEVWLDGAHAGHLRYRLRCDTIVLVEADLGATVGGTTVGGAPEGTGAP